MILFYVAMVATYFPYFHLGCVGLLTSSLLFFNYYIKYIRLKKNMEDDENVISSILKQFKNLPLEKKYEI